MNMAENKEMSDEEIIEKVRNSDQDFYALIVDRYQKKLVRYANNLIRDEDKAIDIVQESFIKAFINLNNVSM